ncbi:MAG: hypothetical protein AAB316_16160 [Bacteroidota bacterium]
MYLAPLNFDLIFKKVFSDPDIAKAYLEDMLGVIIQRIEPLPLKHKLTDAALPVEFDFHCVINHKPVIVEMQQGYKTQEVRRFYAYHSIITALQLENLAAINEALNSEEKKKVLLYNALEPVITIVWMVHDTLGFTDDYVGFCMQPEPVGSFILNEELWSETVPSARLLDERQRVAALLKNKTKSLDFLPQNRLIYAFQPNIVRNKKNEKYFRWYDFAQRTLNKKNTESDFQEYKNDRIMQLIIDRIKTDVLEPEEKKNIRTFEDYMEELYAMKPDFVAEGKEEGRVIGREEGREEGKDLGLDLAVKIIALNSKGKPAVEIANELNLDPKKVQLFLSRLNQVSSNGKKSSSQ